MAAKILPSHLRGDSVCSSRYDAVAGLPYESSQYKFLQHLVPQRQPGQRQRAPAHLEASANDNYQRGSSKLLDAIDHSYNLKSSTGMLNNSRFAVENSQQGIGSSLNSNPLNSNPRNLVSSLHTDSLVDPYMHNQRDLHVLWIKPQEFFKDERCNQEDFSLKDISILMKKKGEVQVKRVVSRFQPNREQIYGN